MNFDQEQLKAFVIAVIFIVAFLIGKVLEAIMRAKQLDLVLYIFITLELYIFFTGIGAIMSVFALYNTFGGK